MPTDKMTLSLKEATQLADALEIADVELILAWADHLQVGGAAEPSFLLQITQAPPKAAALTTIFGGGTGNGQPLASGGEHRHHSPIVEQGRGGHVVAGEFGVASLNEGQVVVPMRPVLAGALGVHHLPVQQIEIFALTLKRQLMDRVDAP